MIAEKQSKDDSYLHLDDIDWTPDRLAHGLDRQVERSALQGGLFKVVAANCDMDWVITSDLTETVTTQAAQAANDVRWQVEELHRGLKQLTGSAKC